jgi:hypothetical protein
VNSKKSDESLAAMHHPGTDGQRLSVRAEGVNRWKKDGRRRRRSAVRAKVVAEVGSCASWRSPVDFFYVFPTRRCGRQEIGFMRSDY